MREDDIVMRIARRLNLALTRGGEAKLTHEMVKYITSVPGGLVAMGLAQAEKIKEEKYQEYLKSEAHRKREWRKKMGIKTNRSITTTIARKIRESREAGMTYKAIAELYSVSISTAEYYGSDDTQAKRKEYQRRRYEKRRNDPVFMERARQSSKDRYVRRRVEDGS